MGLKINKTTSIVASVITNHRDLICREYPIASATSSSDDVLKQLDILLMIYNRILQTRVNQVNLDMSF